MKSALTVAMMVASFWWWRSDPEVEKGNAKAAEGEFDDAVAQFESAEKHASDDDQKRIVSFDKGIALSGAKRHDDARKAFAYAAQSEDASLRSRAAFNEGNAAMAAKDKKGAIDAFVRSLRADPGFEPAKRNLEYLLTQKDPPSDGGAGGDGGGGGGDGGSDGGGGGKGDGGSDGGGGKGGSDGGSGDGGQDQKQPPPDEKPQDKQPQKVSEQDAMKILDAMKDSEKNRPLGRIMLKDNRPPKSDKEW